jgi:hypothetical protein
MCPDLGYCSSSWFGRKITSIFHLDPKLWQEGIIPDLVIFLEHLPAFKPGKARLSNKSNSFERKCCPDVPDHQDQSQQNRDPLQDQLVEICVNSDTNQATSECIPKSGLNFHPMTSIGFGRNLNRVQGFLDNIHGSQVVNSGGGFDDNPVR